MTQTELQAWLEAEIQAFPCKTSLLMVDLTTGLDVLAVDPEVQVSSASTIKLPILITLFQQIEQGLLDLNQEIPVPEAQILSDSRVFEAENIQETYPLEELIYWMITESDNTATNVLIDLAGMEAVNRLCQSWAAGRTVLQRKMLDWEALKAGQDNFTSARDQYYLYAQLWNRSCRHPGGLWEKALEPLLCQRSKDGLLRYISGDVTLASKPGGLDHVSHDAGLFLDGDRPFYLGIFTWDGPSLDGDSQQRRFIGKLAKKIYGSFR